MQHLSIILAFFAVFGLAAFRFLDGSIDDPTSKFVNSTHVQHRQEISNRMLVNQISYLAQRVGTLETDLAALRTTNTQLANTVRQMAVRDPITTASIRPRTQSSKNGLRKRINPESGLSSASFASKDSKGLHLATFADPAALPTAWANLSRNASAGLSGLSPYAKSVRSSTGGTLYRLIAGPVGSSSDALARCRLVKRSRKFCQISDQLGAPLAQLLARQ